MPLFMCCLLIFINLDDADGAVPGWCVEEEGDKGLLLSGLSSSLESDDGLGL